MEFGSLSSSPRVADSAQGNNPMLFELPYAIVYGRARQAARTLNNRNAAATDCHGFGCGGDTFGTLVQMRPYRMKLLHKSIVFLHEEAFKKS